MGSSTWATIASQCMGNDSRCKGSNKVKCQKLAAQGVHCRWDTVDTSGQCIGNDSRCRDSSKWWSNKLAQQGINCRWQGDTNCKSWCTQNPSEWSNKCISIGIFVLPSLCWVGQLLSKQCHLCTVFLLRCRCCTRQDLCVEFPKV